MLTTTTDGFVAFELVFPQPGKGIARTQKITSRRKRLQLSLPEQAFLANPERLVCDCPNRLNGDMGAHP